MMSLSSLFKGKEEKQFKQLFKEMTQVVKDAAKGNLEGRVTFIPEDNSEIAEFAWALNDMLDQTESFMRDAATTIEFASEGKTYRHILFAGLHCIYRATAEKVNKAIKSISDGYETKKMGELSAEFSILGGGFSRGLGVLQGDLLQSS